MEMSTHLTRRARAVFIIGGLAALAVVTGCSAGTQSQASLAGACQMTKCICSDTSAPFWLANDTAPVEWQRNGDALCPPGFELVRVEVEKKKKR